MRRQGGRDRNRATNRRGEEALRNQLTMARGHRSNNSNKRIHGARIASPLLSGRLFDAWSRDIAYHEYHVVDFYRVSPGASYCNYLYSIIRRTPFFDIYKAKSHLALP